MSTAREFFESAREASRDAERCRRQLVAMESRMRSIGGGLAETRVASTPDSQRMSRRVDAYVDREAALERRMEGDYDTINRACTVLYGDESHVGVDSLASCVWADILWWRYLDDATWDTVGRAVGCSVSQCRKFCADALAWIDRNRFMSAVIDAG